MVSEETLKNEIIQMQRTVHYLQVRCKELAEENYKLKQELDNANIQVSEHRDGGDQ